MQCGIKQLSKIKHLTFYTTVLLLLSTDAQARAGFLQLKRLDLFEFENKHLNNLHTNTAPYIQLMFEFRHDLIFNIINYTRTRIFAPLLWKEDSVEFKILTNQKKDDSPNQQKVQLHAEKTSRRTISHALQIQILGRRPYFNLFRRTLQQIIFSSSFSTPSTGLETSLKNILKKKVMQDQQKYYSELAEEVKNV